MDGRWKTVRINDICEINKNSYSVSEHWPFVNYLDTGNITENKISRLQRFVHGSDALPNRARRKVIPDDIIYSMVRPDQRHYGILKEVPPNMLVSTAFVVLSADKQRVDSDFLYYYLSMDTVVEHLQAIGEQSASAYPSFKVADLERLEIRLPPLEQQQKIGRILRAMDEKIDVNMKINHRLGQTAQAIFMSWLVAFEPFGGNMPKQWRTESLLDIADYVNGPIMRRFRPKDTEQGLPILKIRELRQGFCDSSSASCSSSIPSSYMAQDGDVIFSWSGTLVVDFWCGGKCGINQHLFKVTSTKYDKWFYYLWTQYYLEEFSAIAAGKATTMGHICRTALAEAKVMIPDENNYHKMDGLLRPLYEQVIANRIENQRLRVARNMVLPRVLFMAGF